MKSVVVTINSYMYQRTEGQEDLEDLAFLVRRILGQEEA